MRAYTNRHGDSIDLSQCDNGHVQMVATSAGGTSVLVCIDPEATAHLTSEIRAWARPASNGTMEAALTAYRAADAEITALTEQLDSLVQYKEKLADEIAAVNGHALRAEQEAQVQ